MRQEKNIFQNYYGALYHTMENIDKNLTIFIVDDDLFYRNQLKNELSKNTNFSIHTFSKGENCLNYLSLNPDLVIIDYQNGMHSYAKNGAIIAHEINHKLPNIEVIIVSSDQKITLINKLKNRNNKTFFKDSYVYTKIERIFFNIVKKRNEKWIQEFIFPSLIISTLILTLFVYLE